MLVGLPTVLWRSAKILRYEAPKGAIVAAVVVGLGVVASGVVESLFQLQIFTGGNPAT